MAMARVEVVTSVQRRRRWSREEKERIVAATPEPDAVVSEVARREGVHSSQLFRWRRQLCRRVAALPDFAAVTVVPEPAADPPSVPSPAGQIEIEWSAGTRVRTTGAVEAATVAAAVAALAQAERRR